MWWLIFAFLLSLGSALVAVSLRWNAKAGIPAGRAVSLDLERDGRPASPMLDDVLGLSGRPDLLLKTRQGLVPVEVKSGLAPATPHLSHMLQLAAYCRLIEVTHGRRPRHGILHYADRTFALPYSRALERMLLLRMGRMRALAEALPDRSHDQPGRCAACGYASACDQRLAVGPRDRDGWL